MNRPILFSTPMVQAIIAGSKYMTRRVMKPQPILDGDGMWRWKDCQWMDGGLGFPLSGIENHAPRKVGDVLWVRETWAEMPYGYVYRADYNQENNEEPEGWDPDDRWRPSMFMPKEAARIFLKVTNVRVERLREISASDAMDEGFTDWNDFVKTWNKLRKPTDMDKFGWDANPWVWVYTFERCEKSAGF